MAVRLSHGAWGWGWAAVGSAGRAGTGRLALLRAVCLESRSWGAADHSCRASTHQSRLTWEPWPTGVSNPRVGEEGG